MSLLFYPQKSHRHPALREPSRSLRRLRRLAILVAKVQKKNGITLSRAKNLQKTCKYQQKFLSLQRERRNQVEPRCAERWHLRDDEQFDLAAWFLSLIHSWSRVASFFISLCSACR